MFYIHGQVKVIITHDYCYFYMLLTAQASILPCEIIFMFESDLEKRLCKIPACFTPTFINNINVKQKF